jgi:hypothetical protein
MIAMWNSDNGMVIDLLYSSNIILSFWVENNKR